MVKRSARSGSSVPEPAAVDVAVLDQIVDGRYSQPHDILGPHPHRDTVTVRVLRPMAEAVSVVMGDTSFALSHEHRGVWVGVLPVDEVPDYRLLVTYADEVFAADDPYRFLPSLGAVDLHLLGEGRHEEMWRVLGAHQHTFDSPHGLIHGVSFAVWAPNAHGVRVVGTFNHWDAQAHPMRSLGSSGVWELFVPDIHDGTVYKFAVLGQDDLWREKADPCAFATELPPATGSVVFTSRYTWGDQSWLNQRETYDALRSPMSIYEVHLGSWRHGLSYVDLAVELVDYARRNGFTHVEFMPVAEHPFGGSWGYQVTSYFAPTSRFGSPDDLRFLIDALHRAGIGVIVDWVPAHFPKDEWALARFDGTPLYEHPDPQRGEHPDWGTYVFNFGRAEVRNFLVANALYWLEEFHVDGIRVDAVASMLYLDYSREPGQWSPNEHGGRENLDAVAFLQEMNATAYRRVPGIVTIAEESTSWPGVTRPTYLGGLGFGLKWNMGWMHDSLDYVKREAVHRQFHHHELTFAMMYAYSENFVLPISHDEVVHGKGSLINKIAGDRWQQLANLRAYLGFMWAHPGKKLLFMGSEWAQSAEWNADKGLDWWLLEYPEHAGIAQAMSDINHVYRDTPALWQQDTDPDGFSWIDANDAVTNVYSWLRFDDEGNALACVVNMSPIPRFNYRLGLPTSGYWRETLNTDAAAYGGSGVGNLGGVQADGPPWHGLSSSANITVPPMATLWLRAPARD
ncbi:MAG: 1,4-alpha-glucan branching protein GlgB [Candidatus Nanopelagicales bacterium]|nr:1,4-alpha-glucan branching protein GlgB [Candidatus Nanopelagicales bacterium]